MDSGYRLDYPFKRAGGSGFWEEKGLPIAMSFMGIWNDYLKQNKEKQCVKSSATPQNFGDAYSIRLLSLFKSRVHKW